ncbi:O-antigen ligase family protein [Patescibacteria group bacterium]|nr:O-antigen ligase family protein [Patescibacteria group bacterium]MBU1074619.1 O-antigen ligase family protein [Patescibacteria group bacterium]MBU1952408.1 O-antigen ligase family protein [Patescibacteria group bacterium]MBU2235554.1 O-antigen ligase family protein [Patescibacteria group bacterium]
MKSIRILGRTFGYTLLFIALIETISYAAYFFPVINMAGFFVLILVAVGLAIWKIEYGVYFILAELIIGSKGYLFFYEVADTSISLRLGLFLSIFVVWLIRELISRKFKFKNIGLIKWYGVLLFFVIVGILVGYFNDNPIKDIFYDVNGWLFFALLPVFITAISNAGQIQKVLQVASAAVSAMLFKTVLLLFVFSHQIEFVLPSLYKWVRTTGVGEITKMDNNFYRIFFQSHIFALFAFFIVAIIIINVSKKQFKTGDYILYWSLGFFSALVTFISYSRSFWAAGVVGLAFLMYTVLFIMKLSKKKTFQVAFAFVVVFFSVYLAALVIIKFPWPNPSTFSGGLIEERTTGVTEESASASRFKLLGPLADKIRENPLLGSGFGTSITYETSDPRALEASPDGLFTTYSFEWGYLDTWIEMGIFGLIAYLSLLVALFRYGLKLYKEYVQNPLESSLILGLLTGLVVLAAINVTTPYLNHPLGIGYILLATAIFVSLKKSISTGQDQT